MFEKMSESSGNIIGFSIVGNLEKSDYEYLRNELKAVIDEYEIIRLLLDVRLYVTEYPSAWGENLKFSHTYHHKIEKLAVIGEETRDEHFAQHAKYFYAQEAKFFTVFERQLAWNWLKED